MAAKDFTLSRVFDAPREVLWRCFTEPEQLQQWWGPKGFTVAAAAMDLRVGGTYHYGLTAPKGATMWGKFIYRDIRAPEELLFISSFSDAAGGTTRHPGHTSWPLETLSIFRFEALPDGRTRFTIRSTPHNATAEEQRTFEASHAAMRQGWSGTLDQLEAYLAMPDRQGSA